jgi:hypothetical protein
VTRSAGQKAHVDYLEFCREVERPWVWVHVYRTRATLTIDMTPGGYPLTAEGREAAKDLLLDCLPRGASFEVGARRIVVLKAIAALARSLAWNLYEVALDYRPEMVPACERTVSVPSDDGPQEEIR